MLPPVCPGPVKTEFFDHCGTGETLSAFKLFFMAQPEKVARQAWRDAMKKKESFCLRHFHEKLPYSVKGCAAPVADQRKGLVL